MSEQAQKVIADIHELAKRAHAFVEGLENLACAGVVWLEAIGAAAGAICYQHQTGDRDELKTIEQVAKYLQVSERTIREWMATRDFPDIGPGKLNRFDMNEVCGWLTEQRKHSKPNHNER